MELRQMVHSKPTRKIIALSVLMLTFAAAWARTAIPELSSPVMDVANVVDAKTESALNNYLMAVSRQTGVQVAVLTVPRLKGESIEEFSMRVAEKWQLGQSREDNGVLLTVAMEEHSLRIEVGYGLEGVLTDTKCGLIIRNSITPQFKDGDYSQGIVNGVLQIVRVATGGVEISTDLRLDEDESDVAVGDVFAVLWFIFIVIMMITSRAGFGPLGLFWWLSLLTGTPFTRRYPRGGGSFFGGSSHSGGGFGGGFHGGGGGFGGGGASGKW